MNSTDEMGSVMVQMVPQDAKDQTKLNESVMAKFRKALIGSVLLPFMCVLSVLVALIVLVMKHRKRRRGLHEGERA